MSIEVIVAPRFKKDFNKLSGDLQEEVYEKIELFKDLENHQKLRVHTLKGRMQGRLSFSVNYKYRIVFLWEKKNKSAYLLTVGDHSIYQ